MRCWWIVLYQCIPPNPIWLFIYLAVPGLSCSMWDLLGSLVEACKHLAVACVSSLIRDQTQPPPLDWECWVLATGPSGKSLLTLFWSMISPTLSFGILNRSIREEGLPGGVVVKNLPANAGDIRDAGSIPGMGRSLEEEMATHSSILIWKIPWTEARGEIWDRFFLTSFQRNNPADISSVTSSLQNCEKINFCCFNLSICGSLLPPN